MAETQDFTVSFWGVRGSIACPGSEHYRYGGNTSCVAMRCGAHQLVFDAGTGVRPLGRQLVRNGTADIDLFLSHTHLDHIVGLPFFAPLYAKRGHVRIWAGHLKPEDTLYSALCRLMEAPLFPVPPSVFTAETAFKDFVAGEAFSPHPGIRLRTTPLNHPNGATAYRVEYGGRAVCYVTDTEHDEGRRDERILDLVAGADLMIYDSAYTDEEFPRYRGWGHSTWQEGVRLADAAEVGRLVLYHHDPTHDDAVLDRIARAAEKRRPGTMAAYEGLVLEL